MLKTCICLLFSIYKNFAGVSFLGAPSKELENRICGFRVLRLLERFALLPLGYETDERGSLGFNFDRRRWRGEGEI